MLGNLKSVSKLDSFDISFLVLTGKLRIGDSFDQAFVEVAKMNREFRKTYLWGPESNVLSSALKREWMRVVGPILIEIRDAFDLSGDVTVDAKRVKKALRKLKKIGRAFREAMSSQIETVMEIVQSRAIQHYQFQMAHSTVAKGDLTNWEKLSREITADHIEQYLERFPQEDVHEEIERMVRIVETNPKMRGIDRADLSKRIESIQSQYGDDLEGMADIEVGRLWTWTGIDLAEKNLVTEYAVVAEWDNVTCDVCRKLSGARGSVGAASQKLAGDEDTDFIVYDDIAKLDSKEIRELTVLPPFHPNCRCSVVPLWRAGGVGADITRPTPIAPQAETVWTKRQREADWSEIQNQLTKDLEGIMKPGGPKRPFSGTSAPENVKIAIENIRSELKSYEHYLSPEEKSAMNEWVNHLGGLIKEARIAGDMNIADLQELGIDSVRKMIYQEIESSRQQFTDHGVRHILGNIDTAEKMIEGIYRRRDFYVFSHEDPLLMESEWRAKLKANFVMVNHDIGYTVQTVREGGIEGVKETKFHPWASTKITDEQKSLWNEGKIFSEEEWSQMMHAISTHSSTKVDDDLFVDAIRLSDNLSLFAPEKLPAVFMEVPGGRTVLTEMHSAMVAKDEATFMKWKEVLFDKIKLSDLDDALKRDLTAAAKEITMMTPKFTTGVLAGEVSGVSSTADSIFVVSVKHNEADSFLQQMFNMGQEQVHKLLKDYGIKDFNQDTYKIGEYKGKTLLELKITDAPPIKAPELTPTQKETINFADNFADQTKSRIVRDYLNTFLGRDPTGEEIERYMTIFRDNTDIRVAQFYLNSRSQNFVDTFEIGRLRNQFELGSWRTTQGSESAYKGGRRDEWERILSNDMLQSDPAYEELQRGRNLPPDLASERPIYGYVNERVGAKSCSDHYGSVNFVLKDEVKDRCSITYGDSCELEEVKNSETQMGKVFGTLTNPPTELYKDLDAYMSRDTELTEKVKKWVVNGEKFDLSPYELLTRTMYTEAQIYGGIRLDRDVDKIEILLRGDEAEFKRMHMGVAPEQAYGFLYRAAKKYNLAVKILWLGASL